ncbi:MASE3 domain-containing protein [Paenibacillus sp. sgz500958]|uniref:sensor domain-containing diguanylate cyclase n=1 Tax=Paenibacillus sp. sgz500958 TaxID=3242475 RepID=UPI0036D25FCB
MRLLTKRTAGTWFTLIVLVLLYFSSYYSYLLFHTTAEIFSICIAATVFLISWNSSHYIKNNYLLLVGIAYLFIGFMDLFHTMSYKGMGIFTDYDYYANQMWIAARFFESVVLLLSFIFVKSKRELNPNVIFSVYTLITALLMLSIYVWKVFPVCFIEGQGLTPFKKYSEYIICTILLASIVMLHINKDAFEGKIYKVLTVSMIFTIISELAFTIYIDNYGLSNLVGHYFKIFSFFLIYKVIIVKAIQEPYDIIFREMKLSEQKLSEQNSVLKDLATVDGLTGLYNHRHIYDTLEQMAAGRNVQKDCFTVLILDIDHFKNINDSYGHLTGDKILKQLSTILKENTRKLDVVGRYGGEEFLIMLENTSIEEGFTVAEYIRQIVESTEFVQGIRLTLSIGIEEYKGEKISELLEKADHKLYAAKHGGRNQTTM